MHSIRTKILKQLIKRTSSSESWIFSKQNLRDSANCFCFKAPFVSSSFSVFNWFKHFLRASFSAFKTCKPFTGSLKGEGELGDRHWSWVCGDECSWRLVSSGDSVSKRCWLRSRQCSWVSDCWMNYQWQAGGGSWSTPGTTASCWFRFPPASGTVERKDGRDRIFREGSVATVGIVEVRFFEVQQTYLRPPARSEVLTNVLPDCTNLLHPFWAAGRAFQQEIMVGYLHFLAINGHCSIPFCGNSLQVYVYRLHRTPWYV